MSTLPRLKVPEDVAELIRGMHPQLKRKVRESLRIILANPAEGKALKDELIGLRSFQVGRFRIIYRLHENIVEIVAIGPRAQIYEATYRLLKKQGDT
jgi:mRNA interferase RelE/StbE